MTVLYITLGIVAFLLLLLGLSALSKSVWKEYNEELFTFSSYLAIAVPFLMAYFGHGMYEDALKVSSADPLNGQLLMAFGIIWLVLYTIISYVNLEKTATADGAVFIIFIRFIVYVPLSFVGLIALFLIAAFASQTKPVYDISPRD